MKRSQPSLLEQPDFVRYLRSRGYVVGKRVFRVLRKFPRFYALPVSFGWGLFAAEGPHRGSGLGHFYAPTFEFYSPAQFRKSGGRVWQKGGRIRVTCRQRQEKNV